MIVFLMALFLAVACCYIWLGILMLGEYNHIWKDRALGLFTGGFSISLGLYMIYAVVFQLRFYIHV